MLGRWLGQMISVIISALLLYVPQQPWQSQLDRLPDFKARVQAVTLGKWEPHQVRSQVSGNNYTYYYRAGQAASGPPLVCVPGFNTDGVTFFRLESLAASYPIIAFNVPERSTLYRGQMKDYVAVFDDFLATLGVDTVVMLGNSVGGGMVLHYVASPLRRTVVRALVLSSTRLWGSSEKSLHQMRTMADKLLQYPDYKLYYLMTRGEKVLDMFKDSKFGGAAADEALVIRHTDYYRQVLTAFHDYRSIGDAKRLTLPVMAIHGTTDNVIALDDAAQIAMYIPQARFETIEGAGHSMVLDKGDKVAELLRPFLKAATIKVGGGD
jgi:pimeloyl-ACP methyl ester carboxylesterase